MGYYRSNDCRYHRDSHIGLAWIGIRMGAEGGGGGGAGAGFFHLTKLTKKGLNAVITYINLCWEYAIFCVRIEVCLYIGECL